MSKKEERNLIVRCFLALAEGKKLILSDRASSAEEVVNDYDIIDDKLLVNDKEIFINKIVELNNGNTLVVNNFILQAC